MNLLKHITIEGDLHHAYVRLFTEYEFYNTSDDILAPEYFFPVTDGAVITGFQIMNQDRQLIRASVQAIAGTELLDSGMRLIQIQPQIYCLKRDSMNPDEVCSVLTEMIFPLKTRNNTAELVFPLGIHTEKNAQIYANNCTVEIMLRSPIQNLHGVSPTHTVTEETMNDGTIFKVTADAGRDFIIYIDGFKKESFGMVSEGIGLYRIYTENRNIYAKETEKRILLLLDFSGAGTEKKENIVKELLYRIIGALVSGRMVQILSAEGTLFSDFTQKDETLCDRLFDRLSDMHDNTCRLSDLIAAGAAMRTEDTDIVLVSGDLNFNQETEACFALLSEPIHIFTVGTYGVNSGFHKNMKGVGIYEHFYPEDLIPERVLAAIDRIGEWGSEVQILSSDTSAPEVIPLSEACMSVDGYKDFILKYIGRPPHTFTIWQDGEKKETFCVSDVEKYNNFPVLEKLYAAAKIQSLTLLLNKLPIDYCKVIKGQIEQLGVKTGIVTSETVIAIPQENGSRQGIPVILYSGAAEGMGDFIRRPTMFGEKDAKIYLSSEKKERLLEFCARIIHCSIRSDGAVAVEGCIDLQSRANQTAFAAAAIQLSGERVRSGKPEFAFKYLSKSPPCGFAAQLYLHREDLKELMRSYRTELLGELPEFRELFRQLSHRESEIYAVSQIIIRMYLSDIK